MAQGVPSADINPLLERLLKQDQTAWNELVSTYSGFLMAVSRRTFETYRLSPSTHDQEDAVAAVWQNLLDRDSRIIRKCLVEGFFLPTLCSLARNRTIDILRKRRLITRPLCDQDQAQDEEEKLELPEVPMPEIEAAMKLLSNRERSILRLFFLAGKKYREIADITGIPQNSIGPTLGRALSKLRAEIQKRLDELPT